MKPIEVIELIRKGNHEFMQSHTFAYYSDHIEKQSPLITMISCSDSRVQPQAILPDPVNKIFTIENIGNQISNSEGSVDYGILHLKTPVLLILGHADCGAIKAFTSGYDKEPDTIQRELNTLQPAFINANDNLGLIDRIRKNVNYQVKVAMSKYVAKVQNDELAILGAYYDFANELGEGHGKLHILSVNGKLVG